MKGLLVFPNLAEALRAGFMRYDTTKTGYLVRRKCITGQWELALVEVKESK